MEIIKWYLTKDSTMDYSIFVGTERPKVRKDSGKNRFYGSPKCQCVLYSGNPEIFEKQFGVKLGPLDCVEISPISIETGIVVGGQ